MKRLALSLVLTGAFCWFAPVEPAHAELPLQVVLNGQRVQFDAQPEIVNDRTMVPIRAIAESMGAQVALSGTNFFTIQKGDKHIRIVWNSRTAYVNDKPFQLPVPAYVKNDRTYVPVRFVGESLQASVGFVPPTNTVEIRTAADDRTLRFPVLSDVHVQASDKRSQDKLRATLKDLYEVDPAADALVMNGDLGNGKQSDYDTLRALVDANPHPATMLYNIGNHEFYNAWFDKNGRYSPNTFPNGETEQAAIQRFLKLSGEQKVYYDRWIKGYHFLFLGSEKSRQSDLSIGDDAWLSTQQLTWLKQKLAEQAKSGQPIFVFLHQPLPNTVSGSWVEGANRAVVQHEQLKSILAAYPQVFLFSGHTHWQLNLPRTMVRDGFTMVNSSGEIEVDSGGGMAVTPESSEGLYVEVHPDRVLVRGRDFNRKRWVPEAQFTVPLK
ncbi:stalk domain-containing protein [Tumebacillus permanentifrigoris]|uniref:3',5'-cyclic AMP phosphodiesterase CpdA n=1 Tax=Tumebacillus permanentifrigoris TaxID=378543 RepID=A0A316DEJ0_9BACL|nr:stalk domain-containing protein [Tumebacillus permanentifrigoris]PWK15599.1 3',5'-cyclic AMP phosphodiesterase CpdA [Tumebacillus permanentifrigoris]